MPRSETTTIVFTDLVASTELTVRLGDQAADTLRRDHFAGLESAVEATGGSVVKNLGDGLMVAYRSASDALSGAVALQQSVARHARRSGEPISMRVGVSVGDATFEDGDWFGTPVIEAARLNAAAAAGQILVSDLVRLVAGSRCAHELVPAGTFTLKGLPEPLVCSEVRWSPPDLTADRDLPAALVPPAVALVGRADELARLAAAWDAARGGARRAVFLGGEAGIGKTRLASELAATAAADGATVLLGRCVEDLGVPFLPWRELARAVVDRHDAATVASWAGTSSEVLARIVPERNEEVPDEARPGTTAQAERFALFEGVGNVLHGLASIAPVVLVLEDLHWADAGTIQLLRHLMAERDDAPVLVLGTYRDSDIGRGHPLTTLLADLRRDDRVARVTLEGLDLDGTKQLVTALTGASPDDVAAGSILTETEGNPFFVEEIARHLADGGRLVPQDPGRLGRSPAGIGAAALPDSVREVIERRLGRLSPEASQSLVSAAVIGREFDLDLLAAVTGDDADVLLDQLEEAAAARLVAEAPGHVGRFTFTHALTRSALVAGLSETRRVRMHAKVAQALEALAPDDYVALAFHAAEAAPVIGAATAVDHGRTATERAAASLAFEEVVALGERTLSLVEEDDRSRAELLILVAEAHGTLGATDPSHRAALAAIDIARRHGWTDQFVRAVDAYALSGGFMVVDDTLIALADEVARTLPPEDSVRRVKTLANLSLWSSVGDPYASSFEESAEALAMARRLEDKDAIFHAATAHAFALTGWGRGEERLALCDEALDHEPAGSVWLALNPRLPRAVALLTMGDRDGFLAALDDLDEWATSHHHTRMGIAATTGRAVIAGLEGRFDEAVAELDRSLGAVADPVAITSRVSFTMFMDAERGRFEQILPMVEVLAGLDNVPSARADLAACYAHLGRRTEADGILQEFADHAWQTVPTNWARPATLASLVEACAMTGRADHAEALLPLLEPYDGLFLVSYVGQSCRGAGASAIGQLHVARGDGDAAVAALTRAIDAEDGIGGRVLSTRTRYWLARALALRDGAGDLDHARQVARDVEHRAAAMGMEGLAAQAHDLAAS